MVEFGATGEVVSHSTTVGKTKTATSVRSFIIPDIVVDALNEWKGYCEEHNISSQYVFPNTENGELRTYWGLRSMLTRFIKRHGLEGEGISLYTFRHTFATYLLEQRENTKIVASLMGHKKVSTTLDLYSHVVDRAVYKETAQTLGGLFK